MEISNGVESMKVLTENNIKTLDGKSKDIVTDNIEKLRGIFPEVFCEDKVDFEKLQEVLGNYIEDKEERYRFEWNGKSQAIRIAQTQSSGTLRPCKEESKNWDTTQNLYIEGDNLEVLKLLQKSYQNKIKMIYIDPPYNTGKDFVYKDDFGDNIKNYLSVTGQLDDRGNRISTNSDTSGRYHTDWLNMMYPRLRLARNLMREDGVIFISIANEEQSNLKKICDEIFGEENYVETFIWTKTSTPPSLSTKSRKTVEYILCYEKYKNSSKYRGELLANGDAPLLNSGNNKRILKFPQGKIKFNIQDGIYKSGVYEKVELLDDLIVENGLNKNVIRLSGEFKWTQDKLKQEIEEGTYFIIKSNKFSIRFQRSIRDDDYKTPTNFISDNQMEIELNSKVNIGTNETAGKELEQLDLKSLFDYTKPTSLIKYLLKFVSEKDDIIMDFFSGSATTAQSVIEYNLNDKGSRKFIMVQLPEETDSESIAKKQGYKNICEIGKERIRRAGEKIVSENKGKDEIKDLDIGFKVLKLDSSNIKRWNPDYDNLEQSFDDMLDNFVPNRSEEDVVYEIMLKYGIDLTYPVEEKIINGKKVYSVGFGALIICLDNNITLDVIEGIVEVKKELSPEVCRIVFKDNGFANDSVKTNAIQILRRNSIKEIISI